MDKILPRYRAESNSDQGGNWSIWDRKEGRCLLRDIDNAHDMELILNALNSIKC